MGYLDKIRFVTGHLKVRSSSTTHLSVDPAFVGSEGQIKFIPVNCLFSPLVKNTQKGAKIHFWWVWVISKFVLKAKICCSFTYSGSGLTRLVLAQAIEFNQLSQVFWTL